VNEEPRGAPFRRGGLVRDWDASTARAVMLDPDHPWSSRCVGCSSLERAFPLAVYVPCVPPPEPPQRRPPSTSRREDLGPRPREGGIEDTLRAARDRRRCVESDTRAHAEDEGPLAKAPARCVTPVAGVVELDWVDVRIREAQYGHVKASTARAGGGGSFAHLLGSAVYLIISDGEGLRSVAGFAILVAASCLAVAFACAVRTTTVSSVAAQSPPRPRRIRGSVAYGV
jgi:hypothetical protein